MKVKKIMKKHKADVLRFAVTLRSPPGPNQMTWKTYVTAANAYQAGRLVCKPPGAAWDVSTVGIRASRSH